MEVCSDGQEPAAGLAGLAGLRLEAAGAQPASPAPPASPAGRYRWRLAEPGADCWPSPATLELPAQELAREADNKLYRPQGPVKKLLETHHIFTLKKAPSHHKNAKFVCRLCELHWDTLPAAQEHVANEKHITNCKRLEEVTAASILPGPTRAQTACLTSLLTSLYTAEGLTSQRLAARCRVADELRTTVLGALRDRFDGAECTLAEFGSAGHGCGFSDSCLDLALLVPDGSLGAAELTYIVTILEQCDLFTDVEHDFESAVPNVQCTQAASGQRCLVALCAERDVQLARLVRLYVSLDSRVAPLATALRKLARVCEMDQPRAGSLPPSAFLLMTLYFLQQCQPPVLPVLHELVGCTQDDLDLEAAGAAAADRWRTDNTTCLGELWLQMLQFYPPLLTSTDLVVSIRQLEPVTRADKAWGSKKMSIEDPVQPKRNVSRSISRSVVADVMVDRLRAGWLLFGVPRTAAGAAICLRPVDPAADDDDGDLAPALAAIAEHSFVYSFDTTLLCGHTSMPVVCSVCQKAGHLVNDCPTLVVPPPEPLPAHSDSFTVLDNICWSVFNDCAPPHQEYVQRQKMLAGMEAYIRQHAFPSARLMLFGSSCNGFGFRDSDLDICMTFDDCCDSQTLDQAEIIQKLAHCLSQLRALYNIVPITSAKVPIVKFTDRRSRLEGDISLYNTLAQHNTLLLYTYAQLDRRARALGYMVKLMAKICDICDASRGSLSSYAYTLMMIYYLQQCDPPVLPVLQDVAAAERKPQLVEGSDVSFFSDLPTLSRHWPDSGRNELGVGALWVGFLRFYCERFDFDRHVVCIRSRRLLTKFEKLWNGSFFAIEDPFLRCHNLGAGVRRKMAVFIRRTLLKWRKHHCIMPARLPTDFGYLMSYLMSEEKLCEGAPPNSSGCYMCGRIGHWAVDCPKRRGRAKGKHPPKRAQVLAESKGGRQAVAAESEGGGRAPPAAAAAAAVEEQVAVASEGEGGKQVAAGQVAMAAESEGSEQAPPGEAAVALAVAAKRTAKRAAKRAARRAEKAAGQTEPAADQTAGSVEEETPMLPVLATTMVATSPATDATVDVTAYAAAYADADAAAVAGKKKKKQRPRNRRRPDAASDATDLDAAGGSLVCTNSQLAGEAAGRPAELPNSRSDATSL